MLEKEFIERLKVGKKKKTKKEEKKPEWELIVKSFDEDLKVECLMNDEKSFAKFMVDNWISFWEEILKSNWVSYKTRALIMWWWTRYIAKYIIWEDYFNELWDTFKDVLYKQEEKRWEDQE